MRHPVPVISLVILDKQGRVLLVKAPRADRWSVPSHVFKGGTDWKGSIAFFLEQSLGLNARSTEFLGLYSDFRQKDHGMTEEHLLMAAFFIRNWDGEVKPAVEVECFGWFSSEVLPDDLLFIHRSLVADFFSRKKAAESSK